MILPGVIYLGGLALRSDILGLMAGFTLAWFLAGREGRRREIEPGPVQDLLATLVAASLAGAIGLSLVLGTAGGPPGAVLGGLLAWRWSFRRPGLAPWQALDVLAPALLGGLALALPAVGVPGIPTRLPWGIAAGGEAAYHPVSLYLALLALAGAGFTLWTGPRARFDGQVFLLALLWGGLARLAVEPLVLSPLVLGWFSRAQLLSLALVVLALRLYAGREAARSHAGGDGAVHTGSLESS